MSKTHSISLRKGHPADGLLTGTQSRTLLNPKKSNTNPSVGDTIWILLKKDDGGTLRGAVKITDIIEAELSVFGVKTFPKDGNPYQCPNNESIAKLCGFEKFEHMIQHHKLEGDTTIETVMICWDSNGAVFEETSPPIKPQKQATTKSTEAGSDEAGSDEAGSDEAGADENAQ